MHISLTQEYLISCSREGARARGGMGNSEFLEAEIRDNCPVDSCILDILELVSGSTSDDCCICFCVPLLYRSILAYEARETVKHREKTKIKSNQ